MSAITAACTGVIALSGGGRPVALVRSQNVFLHVSKVKQESLLRFRPTRRSTPHGSEMRLVGRRLLAVRDQHRLSTAPAFASRRLSVAKQEQLPVQLRRLVPAVSMMKAETCCGDHSRPGAWPDFDDSGVGRVFLEGIVNAIIMVIADVVTDEPPQMGLADRDDLIGKLPAAASNPALRNPVLPGCLVPTSAATSH
jgi:hypothetical protein